MNESVWKDVQREGLWEIRNVKNQSVESCVVNEVRKCVLEERCVNDWLC